MSVPRGGQDLSEDFVFLEKGRHVRPEVRAVEAVAGKRVHDAPIRLTSRDQCVEDLDGFLRRNAAIGRSEQPQTWRRQLLQVWARIEPVRPTKLLQGLR